MDEQRDGERGGVWHGLQFYARCAREAWRRSWDAANAWPPIAGLLVLYGGARLAGLEPGLPGDSLGAAIGTGLFIAVAWLAVFLVQFVAAPPRRYARLEAERRTARPQPAAPLALPAPVAVPEDAPAPAASPDATPVAASVLLPLTPPSRVTAPPPPMTGEGLPTGLQVRLVDQVYETAAVDAAGERLPPSRAYVARVTNRGGTKVRRCQLFFAGPTHIQVVSGPFELAPGAHRDLPVLRVIDESDEPHALLYFLDGESWDVAPGQAAWLPEPGRFRVKVMAANAPEAALDVTLACSAGTPLAWTLVEAGPETLPETAPKAARRRRWGAARALQGAVSDAVPGAIVEPGAGD